MEVDRSKLYDNWLDFFRPSGNAVMRLAPDTALRVCLEAAARKLIVVEVQGGIFRNQGFEARVDCILDGSPPHPSLAEAQEFNFRAAEYVRGKTGEHNAFIITVNALDECRH